MERNFHSISYEGAALWKSNLAPFMIIEFTALSEGWCKLVGVLAIGVPKHWNSVWRHRDFTVVCVCKYFY
ncbi:conserved hypothetical protein [Ricinus communis]|uniref:Uncharacterized protein n=1 Tax=Ricinus communis TaxID=3988 RepID=B9SS76_RICCO|nr:conserved hypothetical protein [Ricinus communis]